MIKKDSLENLKKEGKIQLIKLRRDDFKINRQVRNRLRRPWPHLSCI